MFFDKKIKSKIPVTLNFLGKVYQLETTEISKNKAKTLIFLDDFDFVPQKNSELLFFLTFDLFRFGKIELKAKISDAKIISGDRAFIEFDFSNETWSKRKNLYTFIKKYYLPRYTLNESVLVKKSENNNWSLEGRIVNISKNGAFLEIDPELFVNKEILSLQLDLDHEKIFVPVKIEWKNNGKLFDKPNGLGIQFIGKNREMKKINNFIHKIEKENELLR